MNNETKQRMDGLVTTRHIQTIQHHVELVAYDLFTEGFEPDDIVSYITQYVKAEVTQCRNSLLSGWSDKPVTAPQPPPTTLNTLERMHQHCMEMESDCDELRAMGDMDEELGDLRSNVEDLTAQIQNFIDDKE